MTCTPRNAVPVSPQPPAPNPRRTERPRRLAAAAALGLLSATGAATAAPVQWPVSEGGNGHYYEFVLLPQAQAATFTWEQARGTAAARTFQGATGHLATITSDAERLFVLNSSGVRGLTPGDLAWLGGVQADGAAAFDTGWTWVTGEPWQYTAWAPGEPNDNAVIGTGETGREQHLSMSFNPGNSLGRYGLWNDESPPPFPQPNAYVVEFAIVPEPTTALPLFGAAALLLRRRSR